MGISWWWILLVEILEWPLRTHFRIPLWVPPIAGWWMLGQMIWLKKAEPESKAIYFVVAFGMVYEAMVFDRTVHPLPAWAETLLMLLFFTFAFATVRAFRDDLEMHFNRVDPFVLNLNGIRPLLGLFALNALYSQYHFSRLYRRQGRQMSLSRSD
ncbi:MAG TPA: hypothetical protein VHY48_11430 [Acidobacteriaceae bacterium]|nr:hypothetical protein [Acidobacteriaceae bacterium]